MPFIAGLPRPSMRRNLDRGLLVGIGLVVALLLTSAVLTYRNTNRLDEDAGWVAHTHYVLDLTADVLLTLVDAETGQRGFLVTGRDEFLQPYNAALATLDERLALLKVNSKDNDRQQARVEKLKQMAAGVLTILKQGIDMRRRGADGAQLLTHMTAGKERMDAIRLPAYTHEDQPQSEGAVGRSLRATSLPTRRILVVDDNHDAAESLAMLLRLKGQEVRMAFDGPTALKLAQEFRPQVVFLDIGMPGMDGYEVANRLGRQSDLDRPLLVALTGWGQQEDRRRSHAAGFHHHLVKPAEPGDLEALLADLKLPEY